MAPSAAYAAEKGDKFLQSNNELVEVTRLCLEGNWKYSISLDGRSMGYNLALLGD